MAANSTASKTTAKPKIETTPGPQAQPKPAPTVQPYPKMFYQPVVNGQPVECEHFLKWGHDSEKAALACARKLAAAAK